MMHQIYNKLYLKYLRQASNPIFGKLIQYSKHLLDHIMDLNKN